MAKILVIDDQALEGKMISFVLTRSCPNAVYLGQAFNAPSGIELCAEKQPDIVFLDITMPGMDGIEAIAALRKVQPQLRIVMLTAHDDFDHIQRAMRAGANDYLLKPARPRDIQEAVERWSACAEGPQEDPIAAAKAFIEAHLGESIALTDVANSLYLSPAYFSRLFRTRTGMTFSAWLAERRIARARQYLEETSLPVAAISSKVGYQEANSFTRLFRSTTGLSPTEYRKAHKQG